MKASCSIVCFNNKASQIASVLESIRACNWQLSIYVVDNSPVQWLATTAAAFEASYIHLPHNPGYGSAHNVAMRNALQAGGDYHFVLNPDIRFSDEVIPTLVQYMEENRGVGMLSPAVRYPNGQPQHLCKLLPTPADLVARRFCPALHRWSGRLARYELHESGYDKVMDVPALSGCFMLLRCSVLRVTGLFDERYFMYLEDVDLTRRVATVARTVYFPHVYIIHDYSRGSYRSPRLMAHHVRSAALYFNKWGWLSDAGRVRINSAAMRKLQPR